jgi:hypothetical protein
MFSWAFGILLYEMYSLGAEPYPSIPIKQLKSFLNSDQRMDKPAYADDNMLVCHLIFVVNVKCSQRREVMLLNIRSE